MEVYPSNMKSFWERSGEQKRPPSDFQPASGFEDIECTPPADHRKLQHKQISKFLEGKASQNELNLRSRTAQPDGIYRRTQPQEIRVLELFPGGKQDVLEGCLHYVSIEFEYATTLDEVDAKQSTRFSYYKPMTKYATRFALMLAERKKVPYTALSYVWGRPLLECSVKIRGQDKAITKGLDNILRHLRQTDKSVTLWVDQICIDQGDLKDRACQVQLMGTIYERAFNTIAFLSAEAERGAFSLLESLSEANWGREDDLVEEDLEHILRPFLADDPDAFQNMKELFRQPWFRRTWIVQEAVLSQNLYLMVGDSTIDWNDFGGYCVTLMDLGIFGTATSDSPGIEHLGLTVASDLWKSSTNVEPSSTPGSLLAWLVDTRYAAVSDPLDKVYGILGLCETPIVPDYSRKKSDLFCEATLLAATGRARPLIDSHSDAFNAETPRILSCVDHDPEKTGLPSWVPDWSQPRLTIPLAYSNAVNACVGHFRAGGLLRQPGVFSLTADKQILVAHARFVDEVAMISTIFENAELTHRKPGEGNQSLKDSISFVNIPPARYSAEIPFDTFCSTLVAHKQANGRDRALPEYIEILSLLCDETSGSIPSIPSQSYSPRQQKGQLTLEHLTRRKLGRAFQNLRRAYRAAMLNRRLFWSAHGRLGLVPRFTKAGDSVCLFPGCPTPVIIRRREDGCFMLIGECYVHDLIDGEAMKTSQCPLVSIEIT